jgi:hypothetical protein
MDRHAKGPLRCRDPGHVIDVRMCQENVPDRQRTPLGECQERLHFVAGIDDDRFASPLASDNEPVLEERADGLSFEQHRESIIRA